MRTKKTNTNSLVSLNALAECELPEGGFVKIGLIRMSGIHFNRYFLPLNEVIAS